MAQYEHFLEQHDPDRKDFQIDRIILFSDAIFAIAITLLVIEIKAPEIELKNISDKLLLDGLVELIPKFIGFIISFGVIAIYWRSHHRIFGFVNQYSEKLIWLNILFLFTIVLMPFSSAYYSKYSGYNVPYYFYCLNIIATGITNYSMIRMVFNPHNGLISHMPTERYLHTFKARSFIAPSIFLLGMLICPFFPLLSRFSFALTWPTFAILERYFKQKYKDVPPAPAAKSTKHKKTHTV